MTVKENKNRELVRKIREKLKKNGGYCPCALMKNESTKCMCDDFKEQIKNGETGECHCGLYVLAQD